MSLTAKKALTFLQHGAENLPGLTGLAARGAGKATAEIHSWRPILKMAGANEQEADLGIAIIAAESGGDATARHKNTDGSIDRGGWQINDKAHPDVDDKCADNPLCATKAAKKISNGFRDFGAWTTFGSGAYKQHFKRGGDLAIKHGHGPSGLESVAGDVAGAITDPIKAIGTIAEIFVHPTKLGELLAGAIAVLLRFIFKAIWRYVLAPPWHWTQRAVVYYYEVEMDDGNKALLTLAFWATGYAVLFSQVDDPPSLFAKPHATPLGRTLGTFRDLAKRPRLHSPKGVEKATPTKPDPVTSTVPLGTMRSVSATRRRAVTVRENDRESSRENTTGQDTEAPRSSRPVTSSLSTEQGTAGSRPQRPSDVHTERAVKQGGTGRGPQTRRGQHREPRKSGKPDR